MEINQYMAVVMYQFFTIARQFPPHNNTPPNIKNKWDKIPAGEHISTKQLSI